MSKPVHIENGSFGQIVLPTGSSVQAAFLFTYSDLDLKKAVGILDATCD